MFVQVNRICQLSIYYTYSNNKNNKNILNNWYAHNQF